MTKPIPSSLPPTAFDAFAADYDVRLTKHVAGPWVRESVREHIAPLIRPGSRVFEIGCGTGEDALWLARRGCHVAASDVSQKMLEIASSKADKESFSDDIDFLFFDANRPDSVSSLLPQPVDLLFSNFGALNFMRDFTAFFAAVTPWVAAGGHVALTIMGRICPWEIAWFGLRGDRATALRRVSGHARFLNAPGQPSVWYHRPRDVVRAAGPAFRRTGLYGIGSLLPTIDLLPVCNRWPAFFRQVWRLEQALAPAWPFNAANDHYLIILRRTDLPAVSAETQPAKGNP